MAVLPEETHRSVDKETGETGHMERWYKTLCQRIARFVRETLSFSKKNWWTRPGGPTGSSSNTTAHVLGSYCHHVIYSKSH